MGQHGGVQIGKIVRSESQVRYTCQVFGPAEVSAPPEPADYAFGNFVRIPLRTGPAVPDVAYLRADATGNGNGNGGRPPADALAPSSLHLAQGTWAIGLIYDTVLLNPAFGALGPRLSNEAQVEIFSPDYLSERAVLVSILLLGTMTADARGDRVQVQHGVPALAADLDALVVGLTDAEVCAFHSFPDAESVAHTSAPPYLHMGYLPHAIALDNPLLPLAMLATIERLETLFPANRALLSIVKRNFAWRLKVQTAG